MNKTTTFLLILISSLLHAQKGLNPDKLKLNNDSLLLVKYRNEVIRSQASDEDSLLPLDSILISLGNFRIQESIITYAPDSSFKIVTICSEGCGGNCTSFWDSWLHFNLKDKEQIRKVDFYTIDTMYLLPENKYLIIGSHGHRSASCISTNIISFINDSLIMHPIAYLYQNNNNFSFCQENGIDMDNDPYIRYDGSSKTLSYYYANNYPYSEGLGIDTIRKGQFKYTNGVFLLEKESITVNDHRKIPSKTHKWTEVNQNSFIGDSIISKANHSFGNYYYDLIVNKIESPNNLPSFNSIVWNDENVLDILEKDSSNMEPNEYYSWADPFFGINLFSNDGSENLHNNFRMYYRHKYGDEMSKYLRVTRPDTVFDVLLSCSGGDSWTYSVSTEFINDSIFKETKISEESNHESGDDAVFQVDSVVKTFKYNKQFDFIEIKKDSSSFTRKMR